MYFRTTRLLSNKAPKHFNMGQYQTKTRFYYCYKTININLDGYSLVSPKFSSNFFYNYCLINSIFYPKHIKLFFTAKIKFDNEDVINFKVT